MLGGFGGSCILRTCPGCGHTTNSMFGLCNWCRSYGTPTTEKPKKSKKPKSKTKAKKSGKKKKR